MLDLKGLRTGAALTQAEFAEAMGVPLRTYENLESGRVEVRSVHLNAAKWALVTLLGNSNIDVGSIAVPSEITEPVSKAAIHINELVKKR